MRQTLNGLLALTLCHLLGCFTGASKKQKEFEGQMTMCGLSVSHEWSKTSHPSRGA